MYWNMCEDHRLEACATGSLGLVVGVPCGEELVTAAVASGVVGEVVKVVVDVVMVVTVTGMISFVVVMIRRLLGLGLAVGEGELDQAVALGVDGGSVGEVVFDGEVAATIDEGHLAAAQ